MTAGFEGRHGALTRTRRLLLEAYSNAAWYYAAGFSTRRISGKRKRASLKVEPNILARHGTTKAAAPADDHVGMEDDRRGDRVGRRSSSHDSTAGSDTNTPNIWGH